MRRPRRWNLVVPNNALGKTKLRWRSVGQLEGVDALDALQL